MPRTLRSLVLLAILVFALAPSSLGGTAEQTVGLFVNEDGAFQGYTLFAPIGGGDVYLIDMDGQVVHTWDTLGERGLTPYLLEDGSIIRMGSGERAGIEQYSWDGDLIWEFPVGGGHHDIEVLPNGNVLLISLDVMTASEAIDAGRDPGNIHQGQVWSERILEIERTGPDTGNVVWEWRAWDHLVQDFDPTQDNFDPVAANPERIDVNFGEQFASDPRDWLHANGLDYNPELDQIVFSVRQFSEIWVIDHSTSTEEAAGSTGGDSGMGGDLLYRWGNPNAYRAGGEEDRRLYAQHNPTWIEPGLPGEENILIFNNGSVRPDGEYSSIEEIAPPVDSSGSYALGPGGMYGPREAEWTYSDPANFYSRIISGAQRLPNGNTLIDEGVPGTMFEVTPDGEVVWQYTSPLTVAGPLDQGQDPALTERPANWVFRALRYAPDYAGLEGRDLTPQGVLEGDKDDAPLLPSPTMKAPPTATTTAMPPDTLAPTPTNTPTPAGDVDGDGRVSAIDAALLLQFDAGLLGALPNIIRADINGDTRYDSADAALILQIVSGLLEL